MNNMVGTPFEAHHFYWGIILMLIGFGLLFFTNSWLAIILFMFGVLLCIDDFHQHLKQKSDPNYRSFIHKLYGATLWQWKWVRRLNNWTDRLLGKII